MTKLEPFFKKEPFFEKVKQNIKNILNQNLVIGTLLKNGFEGSLSSRTNIVGVSKKAFVSFLKIFDCGS